MVSKKGFTLIELSLVVVLTAILAGALIPNFVRSLHIEASRKTALEMSQIAEAGRIYYVQKNAWPADLEALKTERLLDSDWEGKNPFGEPYTLQLNGADLDVQTIVFPAMLPVVAGLLPMAAVEGAAVNMTVTPPGAALAIPTGMIMSWTAPVVPDGWLMCAGQAVSRVQRARLFAVIGTTYGAGDGTTTFNLPDLRGRTVVGLDHMGGTHAGVVTGAWGSSVGGTFGEEKHTLTTSEIPAHNHQATVYGTGYSNSHWNTAYFSAAGRINEGSGTATILSGGGSGGAHNTVQPSMALYWIIRV
jgi:prepilin-type N-terminal cleavage/methylation domain-containing protein